MEQTECSETSAYRIQTPGNYPKESIQHTEHGESLKSRKNSIDFININIHQIIIKNVMKVSAADLGPS